MNSSSSSIILNDKLCYNGNKIPSIRVRVTQIISHLSHMYCVSRQRESTAVTLIEAVIHSRHQSRSPLGRRYSKSQTRLEELQDIYMTKPD